MRSPYVAVLVFVSVALMNVHAEADVAPRSLSQLQESELIVVGTIKQIRVEAERSEIERGFGNADWGIYVTLDIKDIEKGQLSDTELEFRCFRIKSRRSAMEYMSLTGHRPIPGTGSTVRVYLNRQDGRWAADLPNGITSPDANDDESLRQDANLADASEVSSLSGLTYTFVLPLELWGVLIVVVAPVAIAASLFMCWRKREKTRAQRAAGEGDV